MVIVGVFLLCTVVSSLARRKMTESFCLAWGLVAVSLVIGGFLLEPNQLGSYISGTGMVLLTLIGFCALYVAYYLSRKVGELLRKNQEIAIQVSLMKHENEEMQKQLDELNEKIRMMQS